MAKIIKDCIYGHITLPLLCEQFIDTPEFQRLRRVKQLGLAQYAFPSAVHTRFEHSIGVMHLTGKVIDQISKIYHVDQRTKELVQLAGLYHDIGHFAFSHLFDTFLESFDIDQGIFSLKKHEDRSIYFLNRVNNRLQLLFPEEVTFVSACIQGEYLIGYPPFLFEIVSDKTCGLDVDRQDYINRDANRCGFPSFQSDYIIYNTVLTHDNHLAYRKKTTQDIKDFFLARKRMYVNVYYHHTVQKIDKIVLCMLKRLGEKVFQFGETTDDYNIENLLRMSEETKHMMEMIDCRDFSHSCDVCNVKLHHSVSKAQFHKVIFQ